MGLCPYILASAFSFNIKLLPRLYVHILAFVIYLNYYGEQFSIKIGEDTIVKKTSKLLGLTFEENQSWSTYINGSGGLISALKRRLYTIRRMKNHLNNTSSLNASIKINDSIVFVISQ